ncbi:MAG: hypothetical protein K6F28_08055 [Lachnospiraceae bacterium]|nr:hypothetical protein [Lachnospiraceae bacterium]
MPKFSGANVPISLVAKVMKKDAQFIRLGLQNGSLPIGTAYKKDAENIQYDYYISPFLLWKYTGFIYTDEYEKEG